VQQAAALAVFPLLFGGFGSLMSGFLQKFIPRRVISFFGFLSTAILLLIFTRM